jgi:hypothetical protein
VWGGAGSTRAHHQKLHVPPSAQQQGRKGGGCLGSGEGAWGCSQGKKKLRPSPCWVCGAWGGVPNSFPGPPPTGGPVTVPQRSEYWLVYSASWHPPNAHAPTVRLLSMAGGREGEENCHQHTPRSRDSKAGCGRSHHVAPTTHSAYCSPTVCAHTATRRSSPPLCASPSNRQPPPRPPSLRLPCALLT